MIYSLIEHKRDIWLQSDECNVRNIISYIESNGKLRDAQLESVKTFLYLKIECQNKPLWKLMYEGKFNSINLDNTPLTSRTREFLGKHPEAQALYEYAMSKSDLGEPLSKRLADLISESPETIDYKTVLKQLLGDVSYADYLFSIPMGAGKTWLMAMFVYLNLYFAINEPDNKIFAHNFVVLAPAGLKSSIIPSLKDMQDFDPTFIFPPETAAQLKRMIIYEVLEDSNSVKGSNIVRNPNAIKIQSHQPLEDLMGLVIITNVEKLYDKIEKSNEFPSFFDSLPEEEKKKWMDVKLANELREIIGHLPSLSIMIDEVQHAKDEERKIVQVIKQWVEDADFNSSLGFSGTPYFSKSDSIRISDGLKIKVEMFGNVVTYYPLAKAIGNFLKIPAVKYSDVSSHDIIRNGVSDFIERYKDVAYPKVGKAKLAIYCGLIDRLEEEVYPLVCEICRDFGLDPEESVLRYYGNTNKSGYRCAPTAQGEFRSLDTVFSKIRIVLLAQIGKEGWNCKSLSGVILPLPNSSARNMVLQTSCRCLREVENAENEFALIWVSKGNYELLEVELRKNHHTSIKEFTSNHNRRIEVKRYSRQDVVNLPLLHYFQLNVKYNAVTVGDNNIEERLKSIQIEQYDEHVVTQSDFAGNSANIGLALLSETALHMSFRRWIALIVKESFETLKYADIEPYMDILQNLYAQCSFVKEGVPYLREDIKQSKLRGDIRKSFIPATSIECKEEFIPRDARLLKIEALENPYFPANGRIIYPCSSEVEKIVDDDKPKVIPHEIKTAIQTLRDLGQNEAANQLESNYLPKTDSQNKRTYQYIPYTFDSGLESSYYVKDLRGMLSRFNNIEVYFNGDESLSDFYIECYEHSDGCWRKIGRYFPDFLILRRNDENVITKVIIVETKGTPYENSFLLKKDFMRKFIEMNKEADNNTRFDFLLIPERMGDTNRYVETVNHIENFLNS